MLPARTLSNVEKTSCCVTTRRMPICFMKWKRHTTHCQPLNTKNLNFFRSTNYSFKMYYNATHTCTRTYTLRMLLSIHSARYLL